MYKAPLNISLFFGVMLFVILCVILLERFIFQFSVKLYSNKFFTLIFLVMILLVLAGRFSVSLTILPAFTLTYLVIPMSISAMLLSCLVSPNVSLMTGTLTSVLISFMQSSPFESFLFLFFNNCLTAFIIYRTDKRSHLIFSGYMVGLFNAVFVVLGRGTRIATSLRLYSSEGNCTVPSLKRPLDDCSKCSTFPMCKPFGKTCPRLVLTRYPGFSGVTFELMGTLRTRPVGLPILPCCRP